MSNLNVILYIYIRMLQILECSPMTVLVPYFEFWLRLWLIINND